MKLKLFCLFPHCLWKEILSQPRIRHFKILQSIYFTYDVGIISSYSNRKFISRRICTKPSRHRLEQCTNCHMLLPTRKAANIIYHLRSNFLLHCGTRLLFFPGLGSFFSNLFQRLLVFSQSLRVSYKRFKLYCEVSLQKTLQNTSKLTRSCLRFSPAKCRSADLLFLSVRSYRYPAVFSVPPW